MTDDWQADLRLGLEHLVDKAVVKGAKQNDVFAAVGAELARLRGANDRDPDPAEDTSQEMLEEPATTGLLGSVGGEPRGSQNSRYPVITLGKSMLDASRADLGHRGNGQSSVSVPLGGGRNHPTPIPNIAQVSAPRSPLTVQRPRLVRNDRPLEHDF